MHLVRLTYYSENRLDPAERSRLEALKDVLAASQRNNARRGITGALVFDDFWFYQVLEGEREIVWKAFLAILDDPRHRRCRPRRDRRDRDPPVRGNGRCVSPSPTRSRGPSSSASPSKAWCGPIS